MKRHQQRPDGTVRAPDNWKRGMPKDEWMASLGRHALDAWRIHESGVAVRPETGEPVTIEEALGGILFNAMGYWREVLLAPTETEKP